MSNGPAVKFSHIGIYVTDLERMKAFYTQHFGLVETDRGFLGETELIFLSADPTEHHQIALIAGRPGDVPFNVVNQISFRVENLARLRTLHGQLAAAGAKNLVSITHGNAWSIYFLDPDGNRIEVLVDSPWYVRQPMREPLDLSLSDEEILTQTEAECRELPGFAPVEQWRDGFKSTLGL